MKSYLLIRACFLSAAYFVVVAGSHCAAQCKASFTYAVNAYTRTVSFSSTSTGSGLTYSWNLGTGTVASTGNVTKTFPAYGSYYVALKVSSGSCSDSTWTTLTLVDPCSAAFTNSIDNSSNKLMHFTALNNASNLSYEWNFDDGSTSAIKDPGHNYVSFGTYNVCLRVRKALNGDTCNTRLCKTVTVVNPVTACKASFIRMAGGGPGVTFTNTSMGSNLQYLWDYGDNTTSTGSFGFKNYLSGGTYTVCLKVFNNSGCADSTCEQIVVDLPVNKCNATFSAAPDSAGSKKVNFNALNAASDLNYSWTFGDSPAVASTHKSPSHSYSAYGSYNVCLRVSRTAGDVCDTQYCRVVNVQDPTICHADFIANAGPGIGGISLVANATGANLQYLWYFDDGTTSNQQSQPFKAYTTNGTYHVCLKIYNNSCSDSTCKDVVITNAQPHCNASFSSVADNGNSQKIAFTALNPTKDLTFEWDFGDSTTGDVRTPVHTYARAGSRNVCLIVRKAFNGDTCNTAFCKTIMVVSNNPAVCHADFTYTTLNLNTTVDLRSTSTGSGLTYLWKFWDGSTAAGPVVTAKPYPGKGNYTVCLYVSNGACSDSSCKTISLNATEHSCAANFTFTADSNSRKVYNFAASASATPGLNYFWDFGDLASSDQRTATHTYLGDGSYTVCLRITRASYGDTCNTLVCKIVNVSDPATCHAAFHVDSIANNGSTLLFANTSGGVGLQYHWTFGDGSTSGDKNPYKTFAAAGAYLTCLKVFNNGLCTDSTCANITVVFTGLAETGFMQRVQVYPNPFLDQLVVEAPDAASGPLIIALFDVAGRTYLSNNYSLNQASRRIEIATACLPKGLYFIAIEFEGGKKMMKLIK